MAQRPETRMMIIQPYQNQIEDQDIRKDSPRTSLWDSDNGSIREELNLSDSDLLKRKVNDDDSSLNIERAQSTSANLETRFKIENSERDDRHKKDLKRPSTAQKSKPRIARKPRAVRPMPKESWKSEHVVSFMNIPPFPTCAKSMRISLEEKKVETKSRGVQFRLRTKHQSCQTTEAVHVHKKDVKKEILLKTPVPSLSSDSLDDITTNLSSIYALLENIDSKATELEEKEDQALKLLEEGSERTTSELDPSLINEIRETLNQTHGLIHNEFGEDKNPANIVEFIHQWMLQIKEQIESLEKYVSKVSSPVIQTSSGNGEEIALSLGQYDHAIQAGFSDIKQIMDALRKDIEDVQRHISNIDLRPQISGVPHSGELLSRVNEIHSILTKEKEQEPCIRTTRAPYTGPCRCASIKNGYPKRLNNEELHIEEQYDLCQRCTNDYRGRVFLHIHSLPGESNNLLHGNIGQILECLECDNNIQLASYLRNLRGQTNGWRDDDLSRCLVALFRCSLGWNNIRCPGVLASYLDIHSLINYYFKDEKEKTPIALDVLGQLLCRIETNERRKLLNTGNQRYLLFHAVSSKNVTAFRFLVNNNAPLDQIKDGKSILHEIVHQWYLHRNDIDAKQWHTALQEMMDIIYLTAGLWWEWHSGIQPETGQSSDAPSGEPMPDTSESETDNEGKKGNTPSPQPSYETKQIENKEDLRQNALRYLLELKDNSGRCPLVYAINYGSESILKKILNEPPYLFIPDPLEFNQSSKQVGYIVEKIEGRFAPNGQSALDHLTLRSATEAKGMLSTEPLRGILEDKWHRYRVFSWLWFILYIYYMIVYSACVIHRPLGYSSASEMYKDRGDKVRLIGEVIILLGLPLFLYAEIRDYIRLGWLWPWPWLFHGLPRSLSFMFVVCTLGTFIMRFTFNVNEDILLALALICGWMNSIYFLILWQPTRIMPYALHIIFTRDICGRFLIIFSIAMIAFSCATYCISQEVFDQALESGNEDGIWLYPYTLYRLLVGVTDSEYVTRARNTGMGYSVFLTFIWVMVFFLLNILTSIILHTYWHIKEEESVYDVWSKAWLIQLMERRLLPFMYIQYEKKSTCINRINKCKLEYTVQYELRKGPQGKVLELPQHAVLIPLCEE